MNKFNILSVNLTFVLQNEKICKNMIYAKKKLAKSFKMNFGL